MKPIGYFEEYEYGLKQSGSIKSLINKFVGGEDLKQKVLKYMMDGYVSSVSPCFVYDIISDNNLLIGELQTLTDGTYYWPSNYIYYIENYDILVPNEFISHMKENNWKVPNIDLDSLIPES